MCPKATWSDRHLQGGRRRRRLAAPLSKGCADREPAHHARSNRQSGSSFEQETAFGITAVTIKIIMIEADQHPDSISKN
jgi:hypothetical protein